MTNRVKYNTEFLEDGEFLSAESKELIIYLDTKHLFTLYKQSKKFEDNKLNEYKTAAEVKNLKYDGTEIFGTRELVAINYLKKGTHFMQNLCIYN